MLELKGSCHCGAVFFTVEVPGGVEKDGDDGEELEVFRCDCTICTKSGYLHLLVDIERVKVGSSSEMLSTYRFNTGTARHTFCKVCGIKAFYVPRSNPQGLSVNVNCIDEREKLPKLKITRFGGSEWEKNRHQLGNEAK